MCRVLEIASGLLSLRVKAKDFMHDYFRKVNWEVLMQLSTVAANTLNLIGRSQFLPVS